MLALSNVLTHQEHKRNTITKYDLKSVLYQAKPVLNESSHSKFAQLLRDFLVVFCKEEWDFGKCDLLQTTIQVYPADFPIKIPRRRMRMEFRTDLQEELNIFHEHEFIEFFLSSWNAPNMLVRKIGKLRFLTDHRKLNKQSIESCRPTPHNEKNLITLEGSCHFCTTDASWWFLINFQNWKQVMTIRQIENYLVFFND